MYDTPRKVPHLATIRGVASEKAQMWSLRLARALQQLLALDRGMPLRRRDGLTEDQTQRVFIDASVWALRVRRRAVLLAVCLACSPAQVYWLVLRDLLAHDRHLSPLGRRMSALGSRARKGISVVTCAVYEI